MRTGSWWFIAGLGLLALGIISAPHIGQDSDERAHVFLAADVSTLDIGSIHMDRIVLDSVRDITFRKKYWRNRKATEGEDVTSHLSDGVLTLKSADRYGHDFTITAPVTLGGVRGNMLTVSALRPVDSLRLEGTSVHWEKGTVKALDIHLRTRSSSSNCVQTRHPDFTFTHGMIEKLTIRAETGSVDLEYIDQVGDIELHAGPSVRVKARHTDLSRIRIVPIDIAELDISLPAHDVSGCSGDVATTQHQGP